MTDEQRNALPASLEELARIAKQYSVDTCRWHQTRISSYYVAYTRGDGGERFNFTDLSEDEAYAIGMILQAFPVLLDMVKAQQPD